jgi:hypothetical protein
MFSLDGLIELIERRKILIESGEMLADILDVEWSKDRITCVVTVIDD